MTEQEYQAMFENQKELNRRLLTREVMQMEPRPGDSGPGYAKDIYEAIVDGKFRRFCIERYAAQIPFWHEGWD